MNEHVFICGECLKIFHSKIERDNHMRKDHKGQPVKLTDQEKLLVREWQKRMSREEKDRLAKQDWEEMWATYEASKQQQEADGERHKKKAKTKEEAKATAGDDRDEDEDYHPSGDAGDQSSLDPLYEPSRKDLKDANKEGDK